MELSLCISLLSSTSWDEHMFELILPKQCTVGHIDLKFSLHPLCTATPNIQVTLLKQNLCSIGKQDPAQVDSKIHFKDLKAGGHGSVTGAETSVLPPAPPDPSKPASLSDLDAVLASELLGQGVEVVCGPVDLASVVDLSGHGGILTLTSPQLFNIKAKSFLLHFKAVVKEEKPKEAEPTPVVKKVKTLLTSKTTRYYV
jgi:baculoviral IAP repeat-containing protein 6